MRIESTVFILLAALAAGAPASWATGKKRTRPPLRFKHYQVDEKSVCRDKKGNHGWNENLLEECGKIEKGMFPGRNLKGRVLSGAVLSEGAFFSSDMRDLKAVGTDFSRALLDMVNLEDAKLNWANLNGASLVMADLEDARLNNANLRDARLQSADLEDADLSGADMRGAVLFGSNLSGTRMAKTRLSGAKFDQTTRLPFNAARAKSYGMIFVKTENAKRMKPR